jgi:hypothetical protein
MAREVAGFAIAALALGRVVEEVSMVPSEDYLGFCRSTPVFGRPSNPSDPSERERCEEEIIIYLAGLAVHKDKPEFCRNCYPRTRRYGVWASARWLVYGLTNCHCPPAAYLRWLYARAKALVTYGPHQTAVERMADALMEKRTLAQEEAQAIYKAALEDWTRFITEQESALKINRRSLYRYSTQTSGDLRQRYLALVRARQQEARRRLRRAGDYQSPEDARLYVHVAVEPYQRPLPTVFDDWLFDRRTIAVDQEPAP